MSDIKYKLSEAVSNIDSVEAVVVNATTKGYTWSVKVNHGGNWEQTLKDLDDVVYVLKKRYPPAFIEEADSES